MVAAGRWSIGHGVSWGRGGAGSDEVVARQLELEPFELCDRIQEQVIDQLAVEIMGRLLNHENVPAGTTGWDSYLLRRALDGQDVVSQVQCRIALKDPLVGLGAPAATFLPRLAEKLHTSYVCPSYAEVGVALGTVLRQLADWPVEC